VSSFCTACDALTATIKHHPHLKLAPGLTQKQLDTVQQLHSLAAALFQLFYTLAATWPSNDQAQLQIDHTGLLNPTIQPIVRPAVRLCLAMLSAVCRPATAAASPPAMDVPSSAPAAAPALAPAQAATAAEAASLKAALLFGISMAIKLHQCGSDYNNEDPNTAGFVSAVLAGTTSGDDDSVFQLMLAVLALTAHKMHHAAGGRSVWGDDTPIDAHHVQLLQAVGLAPPPVALLTSLDATPHPYVDDGNNAGKLGVVQGRTASAGQGPGWLELT